MSSVYTPAIQAIDKWGDLDSTPQGVANKREFLKYLSSFTHFVDGKILMLCFHDITKEWALNILTMILNLYLEGRYFLRNKFSWLDRSKFVSFVELIFVVERFSQILWFGNQEKEGVK